MSININEKIKRLRKQKGLSQKDLGLRIGVSQQVITNYERGIREPSLEVLLKISGALDVSIETLVGAKQITPDAQISRALQKRFEIIKKLPPEKQKAFITFVDALKV
jgi:transcriptional regulator with XRE-family HTH domain